MTGGHLIILGIIATLLLGAVVTGPAAFARPGMEEDTLYQVSTIDALLDGVYDGVATVGTIKDHGDIGIGTFDGLEGELIMLDGRVYQARIDGNVVVVPDSATTPLATVTYYTSDITFRTGPVPNLTSLEALINRQIPSENLIYAVRIEGTFPYVRARSVPRQHPPYIPLADAVKNQTVFEFRNMTGTIVGFRSPEYTRGISAPGYHLHVIAKDREAAGHLLEVYVDDAQVGVDITTSTHTDLPGSGGFVSADLSRNRSRELTTVIRGY